MRWQSRTQRLRDAGILPDRFAAFAALQSGRAPQVRCDCGWLQSYESAERGGGEPTVRSGSWVHLQRRAADGGVRCAAVSVCAENELVGESPRAQNNRGVE